MLVIIHRGNLLSDNIRRKQSFGQLTVVVFIFILYISFAHLFAVNCAIFIREIDAQVEANKNNKKRTKMEIISLLSWCHISSALSVCFQIFIVIFCYFLVGFIFDCALHYRQQQKRVRKKESVRHRKEEKMPLCFA